MISMYKMVVLVIFTGIFMVGCGSSGVSLEEDVSTRFAKGKTYYDEEKYSKAQLEFEYILMNDPGSRSALEAGFYLGEVFYNQKKYVEAVVEFERYIRYSHDLDRIELARYRISENILNMSLEYQLDQSSTMKAMESLQEFIEDYPNSEYAVEADASIGVIRDKLAKKLYETARLYLKLEEFEAAHIYFNDVLIKYYDTDYADEARIGIMFSYILEGQQQLAIDYLENNQASFNSSDKYNEGSQLIDNSKDGRLTFKEYVRLYR